MFDVVLAWAAMLRTAHWGRRFKFDNCSAPSSHSIGPRPLKALALDSKFSQTAHTDALYPVAQYPRPVIAMERLCDVNETSMAW